MMFKEGQKVRVISCTPGCRDMEELVGKICTVDVAGESACYLKESDMFIWSNHRLEPVTPRVGDVVTISPRLGEMDASELPTIAREMVDMAGTKITIRRVDTSSSVRGGYHLYAEENYWCWATWMIEEYSDVGEGSKKDNVEDEPEPPEVFEDKQVTVGFELEFVAPCDDNTCPTCDGSGEVECERCDGDGYGYMEWSNGDEEEIECCECDGRGLVTCPDCGGDGYTDSREEWNVELDKDLRRNLGGQVKGDCSISPNHSDECGMEFASDVLDFKIESVSAYVRDFVKVLHRHGAYSGADYTCGLHVHARPTGGWTKKHAEKLAEAWYDWAEEAFMSEFGIGEYTSRIAEYACTWKSYARHGFKPKKAKDVARVDDIALADRYVTLNYSALRAHDTIEWRLFDGNDDADYIAKAVQWVGELVKATQEGIEDAKETFFGAVCGAGCAIA